MPKKRKRHLENISRKCSVCDSTTQYTGGHWRRTCSDLCETKHQSNLTSGSKNAQWKGGYPKCPDCPKLLSRYKGTDRCRKCSAKHRRESNQLHKASMRIAQSLKTQFRKKTLLKENVSENFIKYVGCSVEELRVHLEKQFWHGMSWQNYALKGWHIDHIKPLSLFDLHKKEELYKAFHYTNLQPLWWFLNISKSAKYTLHTCEAGSVMKMHILPKRISFFITNLKTGKIKAYEAVK